MKRLFLFAVPLLFLFFGCVTVEDVLYLRNIDVQGSPSQPPVHITPHDMKEGSAVVSPFLSVGSGTISTPLDHQYEGPIGDTLPDFKAKGLSWKVPRVNFGANLDLAVSDGLALFGGISASIGKGRQFTSLYGGFGIYSPGPEVSVRFDVGVQYIDVQYTSATVILRSVNSSPVDTIYYLDRGKDFHLNLFGNLTINSPGKDQFLNWFLQVGISPQTLTTFVPTQSVSEDPGPFVVTDLRAESSVFWLSATPGVYFNLDQKRRLLFGVRVLKELQSESSSSNILFMPLLQLDWNL